MELAKPKALELEESNVPGLWKKSSRTKYIIIIILNPIHQRQRETARTWGAKWTPPPKPQNSLVPTRGKWFRYQADPKHSSKAPRGLWPNEVQKCGGLWPKGASVETWWQETIFPIDDIFVTIMLEHDRNHQTQEDMKRESQNASHESWEVMVKHQEFGASEAPHISRDPIKAFSPEERTRFCAAKLHWGREISLPFPGAMFFFWGLGGSN